MRLFVSYARVDKPYCIQIMEMLDVHEVWYDQRLYAGQQWWREILRRLDWCEGFIYLLSPESVASEYCQREFELAMNLGRHIFPVLIHPDATIPAQIKDMQYADLRKGLTPDAVRVLLNSIYIAERHKPMPTNLPVASISPEDVRPPQINQATVISIAATAMERGQYDQAVFLLKQAKANGYSSRFVKIDEVLSTAENGLEKQTFLRETDREYRQISDLIKHKSTRNLGCTAFAEFRQAFPDYDPESLAQICADATGISISRLPAVVDSPATMPEETPVTVDEAPLTVVDAAEAATETAAETVAEAVIAPVAVATAQADSETSAEEAASDVSEAAPAAEVEDGSPAGFTLPLLDWAAVEGGMITLTINEKSGQQQKHFYVDSFTISKYPVTNGQYQAFLTAEDGYANADWWNFSEFARTWRENNPESQTAHFSGDDRPREMVTWFDAIAFTRWLSAKLGKPIGLPTSAQWQRAAQGDDNRVYPWGEAFDPERANTRESNLKTTTPVTRYPTGASPFGVFDMAGNVWEWCLNTKGDAESQTPDLTTLEDRAVYGGSFVSPQERSENMFHYYLNPQTSYASLGFRLIITE